MRTTETQASEASATGQGEGGPKGPKKHGPSADAEGSFALERSGWELSEVSDPLLNTPALLASMPRPRAISDNSSRSDKGWGAQPPGERVRENTRQGVVAYRLPKCPLAGRRPTSADAQRQKEEHR